MNSCSSLDGLWTHILCAFASWFGKFLLSVSLLPKVMNSPVINPGKFHMSLYAGAHFKICWYLIICLTIWHFLLIYLIFLNLLYIAYIQVFFSLVYKIILEYIWSRVEMQSTRFIFENVKTPVLRAFPSQCILDTENREEESLFLITLCRFVVAFWNTFILFSKPIIPKFVLFLMFNLQK